VFGIAAVDLPVLGAGVLFIGAGLAGLLLLTLRGRARVGTGLEMDASLRALKIAAGFVKPELAPVVEADSMTEVEGLRAESAVRGAPPGAAEVSEAQQLLARLFALRMLVSDVTEEIHTLRDVYNLDDDVVEDIDEADDDLADMTEGDFPLRPKRAPKVIEAA
jgi:hypothetical protein